MLTNSNGDGFTPVLKGIKPMKEIKKEIKEQPIKESLVTFVYLTRNGLPKDGNMSIPFNSKDEWDTNKGSIVKLEDGKVKLKVSLENTIFYLINKEGFYKV